MDRRGPVAGADRQPLAEDALLNAIADAFEQTDVLYPAWRECMEAGRLEEAYLLVALFELGMT